MRLPYVVGPPVKLPTDFFGRAAQTRQFFDTLAGPQVQCVSVLGLRRAGKTSFLQHVAHPQVMAGFLSDADRRRLERLRALEPGELAHARTGFDDERLPELLLRYRARNFPHTLNEAERARWLAHRTGRLMDGEGGALTIAALFDRIDALVETVHDERGQAVLEALYAWAEHVAPEG